MGTNLEFAVRLNFPLIDQLCYIECLFISRACLIVYRVTNLAGSWVMMTESCSDRCNERGRKTATKENCTKKN